ncbi:abscisate beta-glucosyltransferase-like [Camellia sinensis]|uniref:abscisate beta-glucosyltransferase-like n=1 Tax=Camellia sinensis TaxID=4442 RepID=UPI001036E0EF|nr:abscisate beta-glucosyltransferase-like [Camellia sinensis]
MDSSNDGKVEMFFLPWIVQRGHMIPAIDTARVFAAHGAKVTIITTPGYAQIFQKSIERDQSLGHEISFHTFKLPTAEFGLPEGCENLLAGSLGMMEKVCLAIQKLQQPIEQFIRERRPDCIVSDMFHPWTADVGARLAVPRFLLCVTGLFSLCCEESLRRYTPQDKVSSEAESFGLPGLPDDNIVFTKSKIPYWFTKKGTGYGQFADNITESELKSYGIIINSFYDLEPAYAEYFKNEMGRKLWLVGPVCLFNNAAEEKAERGEKNSIDEGTILKWLDSKQPKSVIYVSFGSQSSMVPEQFLELAHALEASGCPFIWVARDMSEYGQDEKEKKEGSENRGKKLPEGFEERVTKSGQGLILKKWAPQLLILEHANTGGFLTHSGWNSVIEGIGAGVPMITWPLIADQFFNESLVVDVLKIGIRVGNEKWSSYIWEPKMSVTREKVEAAVKWLMGGGSDEVEEMRRRVKELSEKAKKAANPGGSSNADIIALINELKSRRPICANNL